MGSNLQLNPNLHSFKRQMMAWQENKTDVKMITKHLKKSTTQKVNCRPLMSCVTEFTHHWYELPCHEEKTTGMFIYFCQYVCRMSLCSASQRTGLCLERRVGTKPSE